MLGACSFLAEIARAEEFGCEIVKLFPGDLYEPKFVKAIKDRCPWTSIMPTGRISPKEENPSAWFNARVGCAGMESNLISKEIIANGNYAKLTQDVKDALGIIAN